jgi:hypothetical protein
MDGKIIIQTKWTSLANFESGTYFFYPFSLWSPIFLILPFCCDVAVAQINYPNFKHNTQDSIEQARGQPHKEGLSQIFMLDDMQFFWGGFGRYLG